MTDALGRYELRLGSQPPLTLPGARHTPFVSLALMLKSLSLRKAIRDATGVEPGITSAIVGTSGAVAAGSSSVAPVMTARSSRSSRLAGIPAPLSLGRVRLADGDVKTARPRKPSSARKAQ